MTFETNAQEADSTLTGTTGSDTGERGSVAETDGTDGTDAGERADRRDRPVVYFVLPCYNEAEGLAHTADVLAAKVAHLTETGRISAQSRILFVDDGSKDATWSIIRSLHERDAHLFGGVKLSHNRGHQNALLAGLMTACAPHARRTPGSNAPPPKPSTRCSNGWAPKPCPTTPTTGS